MKDCVVLYFLFFIPGFLFGQNQIYKPHFQYQCLNEISYNTDYIYITDLEGNPCNSLYKDGVFNGFEIPKPGLYKIIFQMYDVKFDQFELIEIGAGELIIDTINLPIIRIGYLVSNPPRAVASYCGEIANGHKIDYYHNGIIRLESTFQNGRLVDTVKEYYRSGTIKEIFIPYKKRISYYYNGMIERILEFDDRYIRFHYKSYSKCIEFYDDGTIKRSSLHRKLKFNEIEYNEEGQIVKTENSTSLIRYYSNNQIMLQVEGKFDSFYRKILLGIFSDFDYYESTLNNRSGDLLMKCKYSGNLEFPYENMKVSDYQIEYTYIDEIFMFKNGKVSTKIISEFDKKNDCYVYHFFDIQDSGVFQKMKSLSKKDLFDYLNKSFANRVDCR